MDMRKVSGDFIVCPCKKKTKDEMLRIIREKDIHDLQTLRDAVDAGNRCGACSEDMESLIGMVWEQEMNYYNKGQ